MSTQTTEMLERPIKGVLTEAAKEVFAWLGAFARRVLQRYRREIGQEFPDGGGDDRRTRADAAFARPPDRLWSRRAGRNSAPMPRSAASAFSRAASGIGVAFHAAGPPRVRVLTFAQRFRMW